MFYFKIWYEIHFNPPAVRMEGKDTTRFVGGSKAGHQHSDRKEGSRRMCDEYVATVTRDGRGREI